MKSKIQSTIPYVFFLLALIPIVIVSRCTTLYGDDFIYATYFKDGLSAFMSNSYHHYTDMNGRALVHFMLELVLLFKDGLFIIVIPSLAILTFYLYTKICPIDKLKKVEFIALSLMLILCLSPQILREGMLWMAGAMNYILPTITAYLSLYIQKKSLENVKPIHYALAFICGATTEQCGAMTVSAMVLYLIGCKVSKKKISFKSWLLPLLTFLGYLTVILSPATFGRTTLEATEDISILKRLENLFYIALSKEGALWLFELTLILVSAKLYKKNKYLAVTGIIAILVSVVAYFYEAHLICGLIVTLAFIIIGFTLLFKGIYTEQTSLGLSALLSAGMLILSTTFGYRNIMPLLLTLICLSVNIFSAFIPKEKSVKWAAMLIVFAISVISSLPTINGYIANRKIIDQNLSAISNEGEGFYYNADLNPDYSYNQFITDNYYREAFRKIYKIDDNTKIFLKGKDFTDLRINGTHLEYPMYTEERLNYFPLRDVIEAYGGNLSFNSDTREVIIKLNGQIVSYNSNTKMFSDGTDATEYLVTNRKYGKMFEETQYFTADIFLKVFNIEL